MKYTQFVKQFRDDNKDLGMTFADCMKSDEVKKAFKEYCGCPRIEQKDGNVNVILQFGEKDDPTDLAANMDRGQGPRPGTTRPGPGIPQRKPAQTAQMPPMYQAPPPSPPPPPMVQTQQPFEQPAIEDVSMVPGRSEISSFSPSDADTLTTFGRPAQGRVFPAGDDSIIDDDSDYPSSDDETMSTMTTFQDPNVRRVEPSYRTPLRITDDAHTTPPSRFIRAIDQGNINVNKRRDNALNDFEASTVGSDIYRLDDPTVTSGFTDMPPLEYAPTISSKDAESVATFAESTLDGKSVDTALARRVASEALDDIINVMGYHAEVDMEDDDKKLLNQQLTKIPDNEVDDYHRRVYEEIEKQKREKYGAAYLLSGGVLAAIFKAYAEANGQTMDSMMKAMLKKENLSAAINEILLWAGYPGGYAQIGSKIATRGLIYNFFNVVREGEQPPPESEDDGRQVISERTAQNIEFGVDALWQMQGVYDRLPAVGQMAVATIGGVAGANLAAINREIIRVAAPALVSGMTNVAGMAAEFAIENPMIAVPAAILAVQDPRLENTMQSLGMLALGNQRTYNALVGQLGDFWTMWSQRGDFQNFGRTPNILDIVDMRRTLNEEARQNRQLTQRRTNLRSGDDPEQQMERERIERALDPYRGGEQGPLADPTRVGSRDMAANFELLSAQYGPEVARSMLQGLIGGSGVINCCPAVRGGALKASDLRKLLASSYSGAPVDNWKMEKSMSTKNSKVYRNPSTGQVVVAHKGTQGATDWGNNLVYAVTGEMGYRQTKRFKEAQKVQKAAENAFGKDMVSTVGHSQGGLQAQMLGGDSKEIITVNKATRPGEVLYGSSKKGNQTDVRTTADPVSAFRSPFASKKKSVTIDAGTTDPLKAHSYETLDLLGDTLVGEQDGTPVMNPMQGQGVRDSALARFEEELKNKLWKGKFNVPGEWDDKKKTWVNVKAYRAALARMEPERKKAYKLLKDRLDKDRDTEAKLAIRQKKAQKGRF